MSSDREARMLGAGDTIEVEETNEKGKTVTNKYRLRPVKARHLMDLEKDALTCYKAEYLRTFSENIHLFPEDRRDDILIKEMMKVACWDLSNLPQKDTYDISHLPVTDSVKEWVKTQFGQVPDSETAIRALVSNALETGSLPASELSQMTKIKPNKVRVRYDQWWVTATMEGMISFVINSVRHEHPNVSEDAIKNWSFAKIIEAAQIVERITTASLGNG
jgi:hypothetical protein